MSRRADEKKAAKKAAKAAGVEYVEPVAENAPKKEKKEKKYTKAKQERKEKKEHKAEAAAAEAAAVAEKPLEEKNEKKNKNEKTEKASAKPKSTKPAAAAASSAFSLTSGKSAFDPTISSLFANSFGPSKSDSSAPTTAKVENKNRKVEVDDEEDDEELSEIDVDSADEELEIEPDSEEDVKPTAPVAVDDADKKRKRKRKEDNDDLEGVYMDRLAREEEKEVAKAKEERLSNKRQKMAEAGESTSDAEAQDEDDEDVDENDEEDEDEEMEDAGTPPPVHESLLPEVDTELAKSQRTVFLANVSIAAITSKTAEKTLRTHLSAFFSELDAPVKDQPPHKIESIRFRSTAFASAIPKKAAFAKKELMEATTRSTNAYVVYSSPQLSREAARRLNGTVVLDRHIRVDEVAHPAKVDHKRCIFVGNLGFVDDESNIDQANEEEGMGKRNGRKVPSDIEEGLWRTFATCGTVESVRVVRDSKTRVGKGFAYVQFTDENAVEAALLLNEKKFPPMLPRKLRISRAKAIKRNAKPGQSVAKPPTHTKAKGAGGVYNPKMSGQEASQLGRAGKLLGRAAAAQLRTGDVKGRDGSNIRAPESFIFEGHRASSKGGKTGLKLGGKKGGGSKGKPGGRSAKRGAAWKSSGGKN